MVAAPDDLTSPLARAVEVLESLPADGFTAPSKAQLAGAMALVAIAESLADIATQLERIQRLGIGGRR